MLLINKNHNRDELIDTIYYSNLDMDNQIDDFFDNKILLKESYTEDSSVLSKKEYDLCVSAINGSIKKYVNAKKKLAALKEKIEALETQELSADIIERIDSFNSNYQKITSTILHNSVIICATLDKLNHIEPEIVKKEIFDNSVLRISELDKKIYLPYTVEEVKETLNDSGKYVSEEDVIKNHFTISTSTYLNFFTGRYKEVVSLISRTYNCKEGKLFALKQMFNSTVHPAIIRACKTMNDYKYYLKCLENNNLEDFKLFEIKYEVLPIHVTVKEFSYTKE